MIKFPTNQLILEGPDLSGKSTMAVALHKLTNYCWNIQDRSALSMLVFATYYNRQCFDLVENLRNELYNLNNRIVILFPLWTVLSKRFTVRGDDIHDLISLKKTYDIFSDAVSEFENYPNVIVVRSLNCEADIIHNIRCLEYSTLKDIQNQVLQLACASKNDEAVGVNFTIYDDGKFNSIDEKALLYDEEKEYYDKIKRKLIKKINDELNGSNEHCRIETKNSRRFIYTDDSCISLIQFNHREDYLDCHFVLRSSNVRDTLYYDLNFLYSVCKSVYSILELEENYLCRMRFTINSAHIPNIINQIPIDCYAS